MNKRIAVRAALVIAAAWAVSVAAESGQKLDEQGRTVRQVEADGKEVVQTYAKDGALVKREAGRGERVHFDKKGRAEVQLQTPSKTDNKR